MDASADEQMVQDIRKLAYSADGVIEIEKTYIRKTGSSFLVDIHVVVTGTLSVTDGHKIAHNVKDTIIETEPKVKDVLVHIEPDAF